MQVHTVFGSITDYTKGSIELVSGEARHYVFSNIFEVDARSKPYERIVVGKNMEYVQEVMRAEGVSPWFACGHDEFALCMDGEITVDFIRMKNPPGPDRNGAVLAGVDAVKFQKRTPERCVPRDQWNIERYTPWGRLTYI